MSWNPVSVELGGNDSGDETNNHYDNTKLAKKARRDLPVNPGEEVGMFYGLEVCHDYDLRGRSVVTAKKEENLPKETSESTTKKRKRKQENESSASSSKTPDADNYEKKKIRKEKKITAPSQASTEEEADEEEPIEQSKFLQLQQAWGNVLDTQLAESLYRRNFFRPTSIQAATLNPAILGRRNIVGAAPTGSGKT